MPLIPISIAFLTGVLLLEHLGERTLVPLLLFPILLFMSYLIHRKRMSPVWERSLTIGLLGSFVLMGAVLAAFRLQKPGNHVEGLCGQKLKVEAKVISDEKTTPFGKKTILECIRTSDSQHPLSGKVLTYYNSPDQSLQYGDIVHVSLTFRPLPGKYPGYLSYLRNQDIFIAAKADAIELTSHQWSLWEQALKFRGDLRKVILELMPEKEIAGLAVAMLLGDRSGLSQGTKESFRKSGLSHILAISGLHIGIIYLFLNSVFSFLTRFRGGKYLQICFTLSALIGFAFMTGASPSVCRAVLMISFVNLGKLFFQEISPLNLLAATALLLLVIDPRSLFQVGFQLSFAAVTGIFILSPLLIGMIKSRFPRLKPGILDPVCISLSAQAFTAPLIIWHFGTFPTFFLFANALLLPIVAFSVNLGVVSLSLSWIPELNSMLFGILDFWLWVISSISFEIGQLPGAEVTKFSFGDPGFCNLVILLSLSTLILSWKSVANWFRNPAYSGIKT